MLEVHWILGSWHCNYKRCLELVDVKLEDLGKSVRSFSIGVELTNYQLFYVFSNNLRRMRWPSSRGWWQTFCSNYDLNLIWTSLFDQTMSAPISTFHPDKLFPNNFIHVQCNYQNTCGQQIVSYGLYIASLCMWKFRLFCKLYHFSECLDFYVCYCSMIYVYLFLSSLYSSSFDRFFFFLWFHCLWCRQTQNTFLFFKLLIWQLQHFWCVLWLILLHLFFCHRILLNLFS